MSQHQITRQAAPALRLSVAIAASQVVPVGTVEHNRAISGLLKNAIDRCCAGRSRTRWR
jgi:NAD(P)H-dependent FMN reductase